MITQEHIDRSITYAAYSKLLKDLMAQGKTTGGNQSEDYINYAKLNLQRMLRLDKTIELTEELKTALSKITSNYTWLVLTEGWCGDAAQNIPVMHFITEACPAIELKLLLRDENLDVMDQYLTDGGRSIPKLICLEKDTSVTSGLKEVFVWGPRPAGAQDLMHELKEKNTPLMEKATIIQKWYNNDKTLSAQAEFLELVRKLK